MQVGPKYGRAFLALVVALVAGGSSSLHAASTSSVGGYKLLTLPRVDAAVVGGTYEGGQPKDASPPIATVIATGSAEQGLADSFQSSQSAQIKLLGFLGLGGGHGQASASITCLRGLHIILPKEPIAFPYGHTTLVLSAISVASIDVSSSSRAGLNVSAIASTLRNNGVPAATNALPEPGAGPGATGCPSPPPNSIASASAISVTSPPATKFPASALATTAPTTLPSSPTVSAGASISVSAGSQQAHVDFSRGSDQNAGLVIAVQLLEVNEQPHPENQHVTFTNSSNSLFGQSDNYRLQFSESANASPTRLCVKVVQVDLVSSESASLDYCPEAAAIRLATGSLDGYSPPTDLPNGTLSVRAGLVQHQDTPLQPGFPEEYDASTIDLASLTFTFSGVTRPVRLTGVQGFANLHIRRYAARLIT